MFRGPDSVSCNPETFHITAVTVLLVDNQRDHSYLCKVYQTAKDMATGLLQRDW